MAYEAPTFEEADPAIYGLTDYHWYQDIGEALRDVTGSDKLYFPHEMAPEIRKLRRKVARINVNVPINDLKIDTIIYQVTINGSDTRNIARVSSLVSVAPIDQIDTSIYVWAQKND